MKIVEVKTKQQLKDFIYFPKKLYADDPNWVPPLWSSEKDAYDKNNNPLLAHSDFSLILAYCGDEVVGRNLVYIDHKFNDHTKSKTGLFGAFECVNDTDVASALMKYSEDWVSSRGMEKIWGPFHPIAESWGFLYEGFSVPPIFMTPYNPPYYNDLLTDYSYSKIKDLLVYEADSQNGYDIPERFKKFYTRIQKRNPNLSLRKINRKDLVKDAEHILNITNIALADNWGFIPADYEVFIDMVDQLRPFVDPDAIWYVEDKGVPVGYAFGFPDINVIIKKIKGKLFPIGFLKLLFGVKKVVDYRLFGLGVLPEYHGLGLDVLLYMKLYESLRHRGIRLEANYILEDNFSIRNALEKMELAPLKKYRIYEKIFTASSST